MLVFAGVFTTGFSSTGFSVICFGLVINTDLSANLFFSKESSLVVLVFTAGIAFVSTIFSLIFTLSFLGASLALLITSVVLLIVSVVFCFTTLSALGASFRASIVGMDL